MISPIAAYLEWRHRRRAARVYRALPEVEFLRCVEVAMLAQVSARDTQGILEEFLQLDLVERVRYQGSRCFSYRRRGNA